MKRTIYIESIRRYDTSPNHYHYVPIHRNTEGILELFDKYKITCEKIHQYSKELWNISIKGRKKNVRAFISELMILTSGIYNIGEYDF